MLRRPQVTKWPKERSQVQILSHLVLHGFAEIGINDVIDICSFLGKGVLIDFFHRIIRFPSPGASSIKALMYSGIRCFLFRVGFLACSFAGERNVNSLALHFAGFGIINLFRVRAGPASP